MQVAEIKVKRVHEDALIPGYAHQGDAGLDLAAVEEVTLAPGEYRLIGTGLQIELPPGLEAQVRPRSGLAFKHGVTVLNSPGTIDAGYRGEIKVLLINHGKEPFQVVKHMRIAQMVLAPVTRGEFREAAALSDSVRAAGGFGSSGS